MKPARLSICINAIAAVFFIFLVGCKNDSASQNCLEKNWSEKKVIRGTVKNYTPMDMEGHGSTESFMVETVFFSYSDYLKTGFYNNSCVKGGVICNNGQKVQITYRTKCKAINGILKIDLID